MKFFVILAMALFFSACDQDPLKNAPDSVKNNTPPNSTKPEPTTPFPKEGMPIYAPTVVRGAIGEKIEIPISGNVLVDGAVYSLSIDNLDEFPGATFDEAKGVFSWTPQKSFLGTDLFIQKHLRVSLNLQAGEFYPASVERKSIVVVVVNSFEAPVLKSITGPDKVIIGRSYVFEFTVYDSEAISAKQIQVQPWDCATGANRSVSTAVRVKSNDTFKADPTVKGLYHGEFILDLTNAQALQRSRYCVGLMATSSQGKMSALEIKSLDVLRPIRRTVMSMDRTPSLAPNTTSRVYFTIYDPSGLGVLSVLSQDDIAAKIPGSSWSCESRSWSQYQLQCEAVIKTGSASLGHYYFHMKVRNSDSTTGMEFDDNHTMYLRIE